LLDVSVMLSCQLGLLIQHVLLKRARVYDDAELQLLNQNGEALTQLQNFLFVFCL